MYKLGTTLIFTNLTQASAAADLFGGKTLMAALKVTGKNKEKICITWEHFGGSLWCLAEFDYAYLVLDTEEKVGWFVPRDCDVVENIKGRVGKFISVLNQYSIKRIIERNGKPFPQPQEVKTEESL